MGSTWPTLLLSLAVAVLFVLFFAPFALELYGSVLEIEGILE